MITAATGGPRWTGSALASSPPLGSTTACAPLRSPSDGRAPRGPGPFCAAPAPLLPRWRRRDLPGLDDPCAHAPLPDPGGAPAPGPFGTGVGVFRSTDRVDSARGLTFGTPSRGLHAPCVRFAARVSPAPRNTRFRLGARLGRSGLSPAGSHRRLPPCLSFYMPSPFTKLRLAQQLHKFLPIHAFAAKYGVFQPKQCVAQVHCQ